MTETATTANILGFLRLRVKVQCEERIHAKIIKGKGDKVDISDVICQVWSISWPGRGEE
jgi:hypothetical protein